jgi:hypothetical protein
VFDPKKIIFFQLEFFFNFWSLKPRIRIGIHPKMLDPDLDEMNADPQPWFGDEYKKTQKLCLVRVWCIYLYQCFSCIKYTIGDEKRTLTNYTV